MDLANNSATLMISPLGTTEQCSQARSPTLKGRTRLSVTFGAVPGGPVPVDKQSPGVSPGHIHLPVWVQMLKEDQLLDLPEDVLSFQPLSKWVCTQLIPAH